VRCGHVRCLHFGVTTYRNTALITAMDEQPGYLDGRHYSSFPAEVRELLRQGKQDEAERLLLQLIDATEAESQTPPQRKGGTWAELGLRGIPEVELSPPPVAPWYYEQLAILYRKQKRLRDEVAILERFERQRTGGSKAPKLLERLAKLRAGGAASQAEPS
jgi:hypothetical protein